MIVINQLLMLLWGVPASTPPPPRVLVERDRV